MVGVAGVDGAAVTVTTTLAPEHGPELDPVPAPHQPVEELPAQDYLPTLETATVNVVSTLYSKIVKIIEKNTEVHMIPMGNSKYLKKNRPSISRYPV